ncbi:MAG: hypothetical protein LUQ44_04865 [Methanothrix sp.]|nr:hypothetical protein [Methanothrix sp.]
MKTIFVLLFVLPCLFSAAEAQGNPHYMATDPAISEMLTSINMPRNTGNGSFAASSADPAIREMLISMDMPRYAGNVPVETISGSWEIALSEGENIHLMLQQSGSAIFGKGTISTLSTPSQEAFASGSISGSSLNLEVLPENATELYAISIDINRLPYKGTYVVFLADSGLQTGTITASMNASA